MSRRAAGVTLISIAAFLYAIRMLSAAIFGSNVTSWNADLYRSMLSYVTQSGLCLIILTAFVTGCLYILWAEISEMRQSNSSS